MHDFSWVLLFLFLVPSTGICENYQVTLTRKDPNLYSVDGQEIYIHTSCCREDAVSEASLLKMSGSSGDVIFFESGIRCSVNRVFYRTKQDPGTYEVTVSRGDDDWYEIWGQDLYIKTSGCQSHAFAETTALVLTAGGYGTLYTGGSSCRVEGIFSKMNL